MLHWQLQLIPVDSVHAASHPYRVLLLATELIASSLPQSLQWRAACERRHSRPPVQGPNCYFHLPEHTLCRAHLARATRHYHFCDQKPFLCQAADAATPVFRGERRPSVCVFGARRACFSQHTWPKPFHSQGINRHKSQSEGFHFLKR